MFPHPTGPPLLLAQAYSSFWARRCAALLQPAICLPPPALWTHPHHVWLSGCLAANQPASLLAMSLNQFRVNQPNVADGILRQTRNMRVKERGREGERMKTLGPYHSRHLWDAFQSRCDFAAPALPPCLALHTHSLIAIIFMSKYKLNFCFTRDCRFDVTHTQLGNGQSTGRTFYWELVTGNW